MNKEPKLMYSELTDTVYIIIGNDKYDVTAEFDGINQMRPPEM